MSSQKKRGVDYVKIVIYEIKFFTEKEIMSYILKTGFIRCHREYDQTYKSGCFILIYADMKSNTISDYF